MSLTIVYQEHRLGDVMQFFADAFKGKPEVDWVIDPVKGIVVFKLFVDEAKVPQFEEEAGR